MKKTPKKSLRGRPLVYESPTKMRALRLPIADYELWQELADAEGVSVSAWIVDACRRKLRAKKKSSRKT